MNFDFIKYDLMSMPRLASQHGGDVDNMVIYVHALMFFLFVGWAAYFLLALFKFRKGNNPKADYVGVKGHFSTYVEVAVAGVEAVLLIGFAIPLWAKVVDDKPKAEDAINIRITAQQFQWNARYAGKDHKFCRQDVKLVSKENPFGMDAADPNGKDDFIPPVNDFAVPVNKPVLIDVTSLDVIHSFKVPPLRVCQDAIPGLRIPVHFVATQVGRYQITCAQLCGNSHYGMRGYFTVMKQEDYDKWAAEKTKASAGGAPASFE